MSIIKRRILGESTVPNIVGPSTGDGNSAPTASRDSWTGVSNPGVQGVRDSGYQDGRDVDYYDPATRAKGVAIEADNRRATAAANSETVGKGNETGAGYSIGGDGEDHFDTYR